MGSKLVFNCSLSAPAGAPMEHRFAGSWLARLLPRVFLIILLISANAYGGEFDDQICAKFKQEAANTKPHNYAEARFLGVTVDCQAKIVQYKTQGKKHYFGTPQIFQTKLQSDWNAANCSDAGNQQALAEGWKITEALVFADGKALSINADCSKQN